MVAWCRSYHTNATLYYQQVFERLLQESQTNPELVTDDEHYKVLIATWGFSRLPEATLKMTKIFEQMKQVDIILDVASYSAVLFALSRSKSVEGDSRAEALVENEKRFCKWALSREGRAAFNTTGHLMKMLRKLESEVGSDNDVYVHPDSSMEPTLEDYRIVLKAWTRSE